MAKIDLIKEKISYLKVWLGIFVVTLIGLIGWLSTNYEDIGVVKAALSMSAVIILFIAIHVLNKTIISKINSLEEL